MEQRPLHWSERAKMYPSPPSGDNGTIPPAQESKRERQPRTKPPKKSSSRKGFLVTLAVLVLVAAAAGVVFLWYLPSREPSADEAGLAARNLVREAMIAIDQAYAEAAASTRRL